MGEDEGGHSHGPADHKVPLVGSISQSHPRVGQPAGGVNANVAPLVWSHGVNHVKHHLKHTQKKLFKFDKINQVSSLS